MLAMQDSSWSAFYTNCLSDLFVQVINAGNFWAHPIASPGSEFQDFMGKLNDHFKKSTTSQAVPQLVKGQVSTITTTTTTITTTTTTTTFACTHSSIRQKIKY